MDKMNAAAPQRLSADDIAAMLADRAAELVPAWFPEGSRSGGEWRVGGLSGEAGESLAIALKGPQAGQWFDHATQEKGAMLKLLRERFSLGTWAETIAEAKAQLGIVESGPTAQPRRPEPAVHGPETQVDDGASDRWKRERAAAIWQASSPITPTAKVAAYFDARGVPLPPADGDLRWMPDLQLFGFDGPALVGRMSLATDYREARGLHITWLQNDGGTWRRAERRYLGPKKACVIRLWPDDSVTYGLAVAEGVETALALTHAYRPTWACMDAGNLAEFPLLAGIECLTIAADHDPAGIAAAEACGQRWADAGRDVEIVLPPTPEQDIADVAVGVA